MKKPLAAVPPRLQSTLLQLQKYSFDLKFKPGKEMVLADILSRAYIPSNPTDNSLEEELECAVHLITDNGPISDARLDEIKQMIKVDKALVTLSNMAGQAKFHKYQKRYKNFGIFVTNFVRLMDSY